MQVYLRPNEKFLLNEWSELLCFFPLSLSHLISGIIGSFL